VSRRKLSLAFQTDKPLAAYGPLAAQTEAFGFDGVSVYSDMLYQPPWLPLMEMARHTRQVRLGPAAISPFIDQPLTIAGQIALIDEASQGRAYLGLARGSWLDFIGLEVNRPIAGLVEAFGVIRHLLRGDTAPFPGKIFPLTGGDTLRWPIRKSEIPFLLGSWGPKTIRACIEHVTEVKVGGTANPDLAPQIRAYIQEAAIARKRDPAEIGLVFGAVTVVDQDGRAARQLARREVALYLPVVAELDPTLQIEPAVLNGIKQAAQRFDYEAAATYISDELLRRFAFAGTPSEVAEQAEALFAAGVDRIEFGTPHGLTTETGMQLLGEQVLPALREKPA
jgi:5,10-methylenetetrahydromethanopterin reductase